MTMVVGMFSSLLSTRRAVADLVVSGYAGSSISVVLRSSVPAASNDEDDEQGALARVTNCISTVGVLAGGPLAALTRASADEPTEDGVMHTLAAAGLPVAAARFFARAICNDAILVAVHCTERGVRDARDILDTYADCDEIAYPVSKREAM
jgi:hypothetical protein